MDRRYFVKLLSAFGVSIPIGSSIGNETGQVDIITEHSDNPEIQDEIPTTFGFDYTVRLNGIDLSPYIHGIEYTASLEYEKLAAHNPHLLSFEGLRRSTVDLRLIGLPDDIRHQLRLTACVTLPMPKLYIGCRTFTLNASCMITGVEHNFLLGSPTEDTLSIEIMNKYDVRLNNDR